MTWHKLEIFTMKGQNLMCEQMIKRDGRLIRLAPHNMFPDNQLDGLPRVYVTSDNGFYHEVTRDGFEAVDVTTLWDRKHGL